MKGARLEIWWTFDNLKVEGGKGWFITNCHPPLAFRCFEALCVIGNLTGVVFIAALKFSAGRMQLEFSNVEHLFLLRQVGFSFYRGRVG